MPVNNDGDFCGDLCLIQLFCTAVLPLAFLAEPYLYDDVPRYITMAALGTTVAHELLHSVGVTGEAGRRGSEVMSQSALQVRPGDAGQRSCLSICVTGEAA